MNQFLYKHKRKIFFGSLLLSILGIVLGYIQYEIEPWETIGGFICGIGLSFSVISISLKKTEVKEN